MKVAGAMIFGHLAFAPTKAGTRSAFWIDAPREGFTAYCAATMNQPIPLDDVSDAETRAMVRRQDLLAALEGLRHGTQNGAIRRAVILGN